MSTVRTAPRWLPALLLTTAAVLAAAGCGPEPAPAESVPTLPAQAVTQLVADLRHNDLAGYARHAVPPELHARLERAWNEGRTVWPLTELPLDDRFPSFIAALSAQDAERDLVTAYRRQFAGADGELRSAAKALGLFASQYVRSEAGYSEAERDHHAQLIEAISDWAQGAPLGDSQRAREAIPHLVSAARATGLAGPDAFARNGMDRSLRRLGPFVERFKQVLGRYGLDLDAGLDSVQATLAEQTGDTARVRVQYRLAGRAVDAYVLVERLDGRWYLSDVLRHARVEADAPPRAARSSSATDRLAAVAKAQARPAPKPAAAAAKPGATKPATVQSGPAAPAGAVPPGTIQPAAAPPTLPPAPLQPGAVQRAPADSDAAVPGSAPSAGAKPGAASPSAGRAAAAPAATPAAAPPRTGSPAGAVPASAAPVRPAVPPAPPGAAKPSSQPPVRPAAAPATGAPTAATTGASAPLRPVVARPGTAATAPAMRAAGTGKTVPAPSGPAAAPQQRPH